MKISDKLCEVYNDYYRNQAILRKREISGRQTIDHLRTILPDSHYESIIDIGAGDGSVLAELDMIGMADNLYAVEISASGCESIRGKRLTSLRTVEQFDGYNILASHRAYNLGLAVHVLEHVEHERIFLQEVARVCEQIYVEVPLELTLTVERSIQKASPYGHINFYTPTTFRNLLNTSGLEIIEFKIFTNSIDYEIHVNGKLKGRLKNMLRNFGLHCAPRMAPFLMTYMAGALCRLSSQATS